MFCRYALRTTDLRAAREFYAQAIGLMVPDGVAEGSALEAWPLHARAIERGAPAHWLGLVAVDDVAESVARLAERGGELLTAPMQGRDGTTFATMRDPFGDVIGLRAGRPHAVDAPIVWHQLHTRDVSLAWTLYHDLFGWMPRGTVATGTDAGASLLFAWDAAGATVGGISTTARLPGVHPHWLYFFAVRDLDASTTRVRALGGTALEPVTLPGGLRLAACEDPQRAAFGLAQHV